MNINTLRRIQACGLSLLVAALSAAQTNSGVTPAASSASQAMSVRYEDLMWQMMVPELGNDSPQISILRVDPKTNATQLLIRTPKKMHVPIHWHSANETHTMIQGPPYSSTRASANSLARAASTTSRPRCSTRHGLQTGRLSLLRSMAPGT